MKNKTRKCRETFAKGLVPATLIAVALFLVAPSTVRADGNPKVIPPNAHPHGKTYSEWSAEHWKWLLSLQVSQHPLFKDGAVDLSLNQPSGPVWFLGGTFTTTPGPGDSVVGNATRTGQIPAGKALFFPILDSELDNAAPPPNPPTTFTTDELRGFAAAQMDAATGLSCEIDGVSVTHLGDVLTTPFRVASPVFDYTLPLTDNVDQFFGVDITGTVTGAVADGVYLMLAPFSVGHHTIHFTGAIPGFALDITYHITVVPAAHHPAERHSEE
jgi:hypothetical protein